MRRRITDEEIIYKPRSGDEMEAATQHRVPVYTYSELCRLGERHGPRAMLAQMFKRSNDNIILLQDPQNMNSGHWISVSRNPRKKEVYFFSTYGGKPDCEKIAWMDEDSLRESGQYLNIFREGLRDLQKHGWEIHYNDHHYQEEGDNTATCGIYTAAFLRTGKNPEVFEKDTMDLERQGINPAVYYYKKYFL
jgi:hypothetical protein